MVPYKMPLTLLVLEAFMIISHVLVKSSHFEFLLRLFDKVSIPWAFISNQLKLLNISLFLFSSQKVM